MKIFVVADARGNVESVAVPNPAFADNLSMEEPVGRRVHVLDVDGRTITQQQLLDPGSAATRRKVYEKLRLMIARRRASTGARPARRAGRR